MKTKLTVGDYGGLSAARKERLRELWNPQVYDMALLERCTDVTSDSYEYMPVLVVGVAIGEKNGDKRAQARSNPVEWNEYCETVLTVLPLEENPEAPLESLLQEMDTDCLLPLLDIGQMLMILSSERLKKSIFFKDAIDGFFAKKDPDLEDALCDTLWRTLKDCL